MEYWLGRMVAEESVRQIEVGGSMSKLQKIAHDLGITETYSLTSQSARMAINVLCEEWDVWLGGVRITELYEDIDEVISYLERFKSEIMAKENEFK